MSLDTKKDSQPMSKLQTFAALTPGLALMLAAALPVQAYETLPITTPDGRPFIDLTILDEGESAIIEGDVLEDEAIALPDGVLTGLQYGLDYWGTLLSENIRYSASIGFCGSEEFVNNAFAGSVLIEDGPYTNYSEVAAALLFGVKPSDNSNLSGFILVGPIDYYEAQWASGELTLMPENGNDFNFTATFVHEMGHALGITNSLNQRPDGEWIFCADSGLAFVKGLRDIDGTAPQAEMPIKIVQSAENASPDSFDLLNAAGAESGAYFTGKHVQEVLDGALIATPYSQGERLLVPGIPINGLEYTGEVIDGVSILAPELAHIELQNSLMSHQTWRNWITFMEAEMALLQDIGFTIDRRDWFGYSVYHSGVTLVNNHPFYARNEAGTAYVAGLANTNPWGIGLHVYGSNNDITQAADILTAGRYAIGIRVEGSGNTLRINPDTFISASGAKAGGLVVSYGKNHRVIHEGRITADGTQGIAALFSFGDNMLGNYYDERGSYISQYYDDNGALQTYNPQYVDLDGPLVERFDVSGSLVGGLASLFIDDNALVSNINILNGAYLQGDIISLWDPTDDRVQVPEGVSATSLVTQLTFGLAKNADGSVNSETADPQFHLAYNGNIYALPAKQEQTPGWAKIQMRVAGGTLSFNGTAKLLSVTVDEGATLKGNATYDLTVLQSPETNEIKIGGDFINRGTLAPGNSLGQITVNGNLVLASTGHLLMEFDAERKTDQLIVSKLLDDSNREMTELTGKQVTVQPAQSYYGNGTLTIDLSHMVQKANDDDEESTTSVSLVNPTIQGDVSTTLTQTGSVADNVLTLHTTRASDAYSRLAESQEAAAVAAAFDRHAGGAQGAMQDLVATIDFSEASTLNAAFESLSPDLYARAGAAALTAQQTITQAVLREQVKMADHGDSSVYVVPLGGHTDRAREGFKSTYGGVLAGVQNQSALTSGTLTYGAHTAVLTRKDKFSATAASRVDADSFYLGAHARYDVNAFAGTYVFGLAQIAVENADMKRAVMQGFDYADSDWTGWGGSFVAGVGQRYALTERLTLGPVFWLNYGFMHQDSLTETASHGAALHVESETYQTLTSTLGVKAHYTLDSDTVRASVGGLLAWNHEYLDERGTANASFAASGWRDSRFGVTQETQTRDTATAAVSLSAELKENFTASIGAGSDFGDGQTSGWGYANLRWRF